MLGSSSAARKLASPAPSPPADAIRAALATIWIEDEIIFCRDDPGILLTGAVARERLAIHDQLSGGRRLPLLVEAGEGARVDNEARRILLGPETTRRARAVAVVVRSKAARLVANTYFKLARPASPFRLFASVDQARAWLAVQPGA